MSSSMSYGIHAIDSIHIVQILWHPCYRLDPYRLPCLIASTLSTRSTSSSRSHRIHAIDSINVVRVSSHPRYRLDPCRPGLIASTLSTRSTPSRSYPSYRFDPCRPGLIYAIDSMIVSIHIARVSFGSHRIHAIDSIHIV